LPPYQQRRWQAEHARHTAHDQGHGRLEWRTLTATPVPRAYLEWPGIQQGFPSHRLRQLPGKTELEAVYGITSLTPQEADPERPPELARGHGGSRTACTGCGA
jgi:hypothetical protein